MSELLVDACTNRLKSDSVLYGVEPISHTDPMPGLVKGGIWKRRIKRPGSDVQGATPRAFDEYGYNRLAFHVEADDEFAYVPGIAPIGAKFILINITGINAAHATARLELETALSRAADLLVFQNPDVVDPNDPASTEPWELFIGGRRYFPDEYGRIAIKDSEEFIDGAVQMTVQVRFKFTRRYAQI